eukprot:358346-Prymnesium_polylepis.1
MAQLARQSAAKSTDAPATWTRHGRAARQRRRRQWRHLLEQPAPNIPRAPVWMGPAERAGQTISECQ